MQAKPGEGQESTQSWTVDVQHKVKAPREKVWAFYTDHVSWPKWTEMADKVTLDPPGDLTPNGAGVVPPCCKEFSYVPYHAYKPQGCVRVIEKGPLVVREKVLTFDEPHKMTYTVVHGMPISDHLGEVVLVEEDGATLVTWKCTYNAPEGQGWLNRAIGEAFKGMLESLAAELEKTE